MSSATRIFFLFIYNQVNYLFFFFDKFNCCKCTNSCSLCTGFNKFVCLFPACCLGSLVLSYLCKFFIYTYDQYYIEGHNILKTPRLSKKQYIIQIDLLLFFYHKIQKKKFFFILLYNYSFFLHKSMQKIQFAHCSFTVLKVSYLPAHCVRMLRNSLQHCGKIIFSTLV